MEGPEKPQEKRERGGYQLDAPGRPSTQGVSSPKVRLQKYLLKYRHMMVAAGPGKKPALILLRIFAG
jgi:hypothetical protein